MAVATERGSMETALTSGLTSSASAVSAVVKPCSAAFDTE